MTSLIGNPQIKNNSPSHYFNDLGLKGEPFSTSPDPFFFFPARQYSSCLAFLEISIRLRRGACVILGEIGTGKTTLCRKLLNNLEGDDSIDTHLILNPVYKDEIDFMEQLLNFFNVTQDGHSLPQLTASLEHYLFESSVYKNKTVALIIDEAQKLSLKTIECLRVLLNFETNEYKLLQLILFGQLQLRDSLKEMPNFVDRINTKIQLHPLSFEDCKELIRYRIWKAGYERKNPLMTHSGMELIYEYTKGYPRKICMLAHKILQHMIIYQKKRADNAFIENIIKTESVL